MKEGGATEGGRSAREGAVDTVEDEVGDGQFQRRNWGQLCPLWGLLVPAMGSVGCAKREHDWHGQGAHMAGTEGA